MDVGGKRPEEVGGGVESDRTAIVGTEHLFEVAHLVDDVVVQARLAEAVSVFAVCKVHFQSLVFRFWNLAFANLANSFFLNTVYSTQYHISNFRFFDILFLSC